jgi:hypothetical protein
MCRCMFSWPRQSWRQVVSFTPRPLYPFPLGRAPGTHLIGGGVGPSFGLGAVQKKTFMSLSWLHHLPLGRPTRSQSLYELGYSGKYTVLVTVTTLSTAPSLFRFISNCEWVAVSLLQYNTKYTSHIYNKHSTQNNITKTNKQTKEKQISSQSYTNSEGHYSQWMQRRKGRRNEAIPDTGLGSLLSCETRRLSHCIIDLQLAVRLLAGRVLLPRIILRNIFWYSFMLGGIFIYVRGTHLCALPRPQLSTHRPRPRPRIALQLSTIIQSLHFCT